MKRPFVNYEARLNRVLLYIFEHLDEELSLDALAEIACMSRYHWHRIFKAMTGDTLASIVRRQRLYKASSLLLQGTAPVREIAEQVGFRNLTSFSRAFKKEHGVSPADFREQGVEASGSFSMNHGKPDLYPVTIQEFNKFSAAGVRHIGPYQQIGKAFKSLGSLLMANSLLSDVEKLFVIYHDAPDSKPASEFQSHVAVSIKESFLKTFDSLDYFEVSGGKYAVLEHTGPYPTLKDAYEWLYGTWLPLSGEEPRDQPPIEIYVNDPRVVPARDLRTDIRLPLL